MLFNLHHKFILLYPSISLVVASFPPLPPENSDKCYFIDGSFDPAGGPCYGCCVGASMCCYSGENCSDGLCLSNPNGPVGLYDNGSSIWRRSCTDVTWQDPACLAIGYGKSPLSLRACVLEISRYQWLKVLYALRFLREIPAAELLFEWKGLPAE